jgi:uncharacterized membrane protein YfcA
MDHLSAGGIILLAVSALLAGGINAVAGGGTLLTFPALIAAGLSPVSANVTNTVALVPGYVGGIAGYRHELDGQHARIRRLLPFAFAGSVVGAVLLLTTSERVFKFLVPILVFVAALLLVLQPVIQRRLSSSETETGENTKQDRDVATIIGVFLAAIYGGYFGAGIGILMLSSLSLLNLGTIHQVNGLKTVLAGLINGVSVVVFIANGKVDWSLAVPRAPELVFAPEGRHVVWGSMRVAVLPGVRDI